MFNDAYSVDYNERKTTHQIDQVFIERWSPRAFKKVKLKTKVIETLGEAARWSPSAFNKQPWRILLAENGSDDFNMYLSILVEANQIWAKNASILGFFVTALEETKTYNHVCMFDTGFAWASFTFQARKMGLYTHGMAGLDYTKAYNTFNIDRENYAIMCAFVVGVLEDKNILPQKLQEREYPSGDRMPLHKILFNGTSGNLE